MDQPEYVHVLINHFPLKGLIVAMLALIAALVTRARAGILIGLALVGLLALSAWPVFHYGEEGYDRVLSMSDEAGGKYLDYHRLLAERWVFLFYVTAGVAAWAVSLPGNGPERWSTRPCSLLSWPPAVLSAGICIAKAGGPIRHREFRSGSPPVVPKSDQGT